MSYIGTEPKDIRSFGRTKFDYTATQGQTAFTGADDDGKVLAFTVGQIEVYVNGILMDDSDFTTTGTGTVTLASAANLNDVINIVSFETNIPDSNYVPATGGTFAGNVSMSGTLGVTGAVTASNGLTVDDDGATVLTLDRATSDGQIVAIQRNGSTVGSIGVVGSNNVYLSGDNVGIGIGDDNLYATNSAGASSDATLDIGDSTVRFRDTYLSGGIYLGGTGAANKLDDFEEGTWTPKHGDNSTTMTVQKATYVKVGKLVTINVDITGANYTGSANNYMYGLPFPGAFSGSGHGGNSVGYTTSTNVIPAMHVTSGTSALYFINLGTGTAGEPFNIANKRLIFGMVYETTT